MIDISNQTEILVLLNKLKTDSVALFGIMKPQNMVEHLTTTLKIATKKEVCVLAFPIEKAEKIKFFVIKTENELPQGFKTPILPIESVVPFLYPNLKSAILSLQTELTYFEEYFKTNPNVKTINPTMGELNYEEWKIFHNKHFHHHFKQFGLV